MLTYLRNIGVDLVNLIWFDVLRQSEWIAVPARKIPDPPNTDEVMTRIDRLQRQRRSVGASLPKR